VVIIVEDDLDISPDFFEYFRATYPLLHSDPTLWCVSAWNDNGKRDMVADDPELLYRTDFFPGLGWMLEKSTWLELEPTWPITFWDDWMRHPDQRHDRACIRPEVPRTSTFGKIGVSKGQYFEKHLKFIQHNVRPVAFTEKDLSYLLKENYDQTFTSTVYGAPLLSSAQLVSDDHIEEKVVRIQYDDLPGFKALSKLIGIMDDFKAGVPRAAYRGVVSVMYRGRRVYLAPPPDWKTYDTTWK
jgi:alpha-1,3-mannosyl-glycoprotein beta-1,2-N-acetylglucosaminyltransferase